MKTLVLTDVFPPQTGGSGRWLWEVYSRAQGVAANTVVLAGEHQDAAVFDASHGLNVHRASQSFATWSVMSPAAIARYWRVYRKAMKLVREHDLQAVHCGRCLHEGLVAWAINRRIGLPYAVYVHGEELNTMATSRELTFIGKEVFKTAELLIVNSRNTADLLMQGWGVGEARIEIVHPGVDTNTFKPATGRAVPEIEIENEKSGEQVIGGSSRSRFSWAERSVVLTVGRLQERKGHHKLIAALPQVIKAVPNVLYAIVGEGERRASLEEQAASLGLQEHVQFLGERTDAELVECYQQCDVFVLPNVEINGDFEGFGMVLVEAQACGKPVIAGQSGGTAETMSQGELPRSQSLLDNDSQQDAAHLRTGFVVDCERTSELTDVLTSLLTDDEKRIKMGQAARAWAIQQFEWSGHVNRIERAFETHLGKDKRFDSELDSQIDTAAKSGSESTSVADGLIAELREDSVERKQAA
jgi:phosphatidyl-myo-inositol dimannoside synthase